MPSRLDGEVTSAIAPADHAEVNQLGDLLVDVVRCCETRSVRLKKPGRSAGWPVAGLTLTDITPFPRGVGFSLIEAHAEKLELLPLPSER